jgi:chromosome partitioning protein
MLAAMADERAARIVVLNPKGGCGKTTVATNLACCYAHLGRAVSLVDHDPQGSSTHWLGERAAGLPPINAVPAFRQPTLATTRAFQLRLPFETTRVIVDTPAGAPGQEIGRLLGLADLVLVPVLPSAIDIHAAEAFIGQLQRRREGRPVAVIANRVRARTRVEVRLMQFLGALGIPLVATLHDLQLYVQLAACGSGIFDTDATRMQGERAAWLGVVAWVDALLDEPAAAAARTDAGCMTSAVAAVARPA